MNDVLQLWQVGLSTDEGPRERNEDYLLFRVKKNRKGKSIAIAAVADGMGAYKVGDIASYLAIQSIQRWWEKNCRRLLRASAPIDIASKELPIFIKHLNRKIIKTAKKEKAKLGTTLSIIILCQGHYFIIHIGDTRIYQISSNTQTLSSLVEGRMLGINQLTEDHSWIHQQVKAGLITKEEAERHSKRNVLLQCIGINSEIDLYIKEGTYEPYETFMLCSDGFYSVFSDEELHSMTHDIDKYKNLQTISDHFVQLAKSKGTRDNITLLLLRNLYM